MTAYPVSPNTVLANALSHAEDVLTPRVLAAAPERIVFVVGTQINGAPHIGTSLVQSLTFATAARLRDTFGVPAEVRFGALDNAPHAVVDDRRTGHRYQRTYAHALGQEVIADQIDTLYRPLFDALSERLRVPYAVETYSQQQAGERFRRTWLRVLPRMDAARWWLAPSTGVAHLRVPCPQPGCGWAEKYAERTHVQAADADRATITAVCLCHGEYEIIIDRNGEAYLDLATLYRNLVKELAVADEHDTLHVMVKGSDWVFGSHLVDGALQAVGLAPGQLPARLFCPQIVSDTGAKLSKSMIREGRGSLPDGAASWMLDTREWPGPQSEYVERLLGMTEVVLSDPRHFFRSYSARELRRMMTSPAARSIPSP
ncbi:hypothetical protein K7472_27565 [Streptomyces sp. PTM05]|uniref:Uncharacterized protein n=1 Tax=Streptantibioticus parmotrematis TaxID=2873249 RepID=A0ABS7R0T5_9ACTN|nr:hypothetical protein [Streptantibioticus parmotrematis]MBY8888571.1 hypothetical protein [Streptantibioticus parmotrematis]